MVSVSQSPDSTKRSSDQANGTRGAKRTADTSDDLNAPTHTRSKRNRYISIACNECKRRKIKCNGQTPCQRCGNLSLECVYAPNCCTNSLKDSEEFQRMREHVATLQEQVNALWDNLNELRSRQDPFPPQETIYPEPPIANRSLSVSRTLPPLISPKRPAQKPLQQFRGPTSSSYGFDVARTSLQTLGITPNPVEDGGASRERSRPPSPVRMTQSHPAKDPIWLLDQDEAMRLCHIYEEEIHIMYPVLEMESLYNHVRMLYSFLGAALRSGFGDTSLPGEDAINDDQSTILKLVLACAALLDGQGRSEVGQKLFDSAKLATDLALVGNILSLKTVTLIVLTATYHFQKDEETQAWRFIGIAGRICIELGLHRKDSLMRSFPDEPERRFALRVFWAVYALDRRWSFGTGMPFVLQDTDIDASLPIPDDKFPYIKYITKHNKIATKIWQHNQAFESGNIPKADEVGFLDFQILQWYQQLPDSLKFYDSDVARENQIADRGLRRLRFLMYLRKNQARISIYRPIMHSVTSILENRAHATTIVGIAKDTIQVITSVNSTSDIYRTQQTTRDEFYAAIDLIKGFSTKSHTTKRLWRTIRGLKDMGDKIGMLDRTGLDQEQDAHSSAAVAMAGLAGHKVDSFSFNNRSGRAEELAVSPQDGQQIGNELTALFEMAGAYGTNFHNPPTDQNGFQAFPQIGNDGQLDGDSFNPFFGNETELTRIMNDLF